MKFHRYWESRTRGQRTRLVVAPLLVFGSTLLYLSLGAAADAVPWQPVQKIGVGSVAIAVVVMISSWIIRYDYHKPKKVSTKVFVTYLVASTFSLFGLYVFDIKNIGSISLVSIVIGFVAVGFLLFIWAILRDTPRKKPVEIDPTLW